MPKPDKFVFLMKPNLISGSLTFKKHIQKLAAHYSTASSVSANEIKVSLSARKAPPGFNPGLTFTGHPVSNECRVM